MNGWVADPVVAREILQKALESQNRLQALVVLIDEVDAARRVVLFERGNGALGELQCLALVSKELLVALRTIVGAGPFDSWSFDNTLEWMTGQSNQACAEMCRKVISHSAAALKRLERLWIAECPNLDQGMVRPLVTESGRIVLMCDSGGEVWAHPDDVSTGVSFHPSSPDWETLPGVAVAPGSAYWASEEDVASLDWDVEWKT